MAGPGPVSRRRSRTVGPVDVNDLVEHVVAGSRPHIARALTLVESSRPVDRERTRTMLRLLAPHTGKAVRVGISGVPGAGKSTFIDAMGCRLVDEYHHKVAVLAIDPSSANTGGSILGDRTRMGALAEREDAFVRPSPSGGSLGGVARATREAIVVMEAAGYDVVLVETVGVGQSEVAVAGMVDTFLLLSVAGTGDQLQGIKKGVLELADIVAVNKADGDNAPNAREAARNLRQAMRMMSSSTEEDSRKIPVLTCSAVSGEGLDDVWKAVQDHRSWLVDNGSLESRRTLQQHEWMWSIVRNRIMDSLDGDPEVQQRAQQACAALDAGESDALDASEQVLRIFASRVPEFGWSEPADPRK
ncbi:methylmalonyl Co-A mutase-associated GTPase MeaB [Acidipropionibacterium jensenii]|uniref:methylmalonyl Co-A mutase-associated GTPase MeaB n=1 Tax=Acidipropionibacterium jensenii TaxID=1749 RepID=UPI0039E6A32A